MTHKERFHATIERRKVDHLASWLGMPATESCPRLFDYFQVDSMAALKIKIDDDIYPIDVPYHHPPANHIACAFDFAKKDSAEYEKRTLTAPRFFEEYSGG